MFRLHHSFSRTEKLVLAKALLQSLESEELEYMTEMQLENRLVSNMPVAQLLALASCKILCRRTCRYPNTACKEIHCDKNQRHYKQLKYVALN